MQAKAYDRINISFVILSVLYFIYSFIDHVNTKAWFLFALPAVLLFAGLLVTHKYNAFSRFVYIIAFLHILVMLTGAKYTYSTYPLFDTISSTFGFSRNYFDRVGHFFQGLTPAIMAYELLQNRAKMKKDWFFYFLVICVSMGISAVYELTEYLATVVSGYPQAYVLGLQGDIWDTQNDMLMALIGSFMGILSCSVFKSHTTST